MKTKTAQGAFETAQVPVEQCDPHDANRKTNESDITELADSIRAIGLITPIAVRKQDDRYQIIAGERRWRAHKLLGLETIQALVYESCDDLTVDTVRLVENEQRVEATALQTARELRRLKNLYGLTHKQVSARTGIPIDRVKRYLAIFNASDLVLDAIEKNQLNAKTAIALMRFEKSMGETQTRQTIKKLTRGEITSGDLDRARKNVNRAASQDDGMLKKAKDTLWQRTEKLMRNCLSDDPRRLKKLIEELLKAGSTKVANKT